MKLDEFIERLEEEIDLEEDETITPETRFFDLKNFDSLSVMGLVSLYHKVSGRRADLDEFKEVKTVKDLIKMIGEQYFD